MEKTFLFVWLLLFAPFVARAATCDLGYYLNGTECQECNPNNEPYFCPGDDTRHPCPKTDTDYNQFGYTFLYGNEGTWATIPAKYSSACRCNLYFTDEYGNLFLLENEFNGQNYWGPRLLWYKAMPGFYLSRYRWSSSRDWYAEVKTCTNAPEHAHYTGAGTPDAPDGSIIDANDCPWECDNEYGRHGNVCVPLCAAGIRHIKTGGGLTVNLYPVPYSSPALHIKYNGQICYGTLSIGAANATININVSGTTYHVVN